VPSSDLGLDTGYPDWIVFVILLSPFIKMVNHFQFILTTHPIIWRCIVLATETVVKYAPPPPTK
jgi:hypothetical protein